MKSLGCPHDVRPHARRLYDLASGPWTPAAMRQACEANGWTFEQDHPRTGGFTFRLDRDLRLSTVFKPFPSSPAPHAHVLLYLHAPANYPRHHFPDDADRHFDAALEGAYDALAGELGDPESCGIERVGSGVEPSLAFAIWRGKSGLLVLQQEEYDLQCGEWAVCINLHPWDESEPAPSFPLVIPLT